MDDPYILSFLIYIDQEEPEGSELSWAPTDIYRSPYDTPRQLSLLDLTLTREPSRFDLHKSMNDMFPKPTTPGRKRGSQRVIHLISIHGGEKFKPRRYLLT